MKIHCRNTQTFFSNVFNAVGIGVVIALLPNAVLGEILKVYSHSSAFINSIYYLVMTIQSLMSLVIGVLAAYYFKFNGSGIAIVGISSMLGSGAIQVRNNQIVLQGMGDIVNTILIVILSCLIFLLLHEKLGSLQMIILPVIIPITSGISGMYLLPYTSKLTSFLGHMVSYFTELNPLVMAVLISVTYALLMVTPISVVAIATAIGLSGLGSGAANMGAVMACVTFLIGSLKVNSIGINTVLFIGAAKVMIPVYFKNPIIIIPLTINGIIGGVTAYLIGIEGTPMSAGFGYTGLIGPINAFNRMSGDPTTNVSLLIISYLFTPVVTAFLVHKLSLRFLKTYNQDVFKFEMSN